ncbi:MAG: hypothetical protein KH009_08825 [Clostridiales bacterium]|nr:hypothetical protein [Clostridiales bacterium]
MKKLLIIVSFAACLLFSSCLGPMDPGHSDEEAVLSGSSAEELSTEEPSSKILIPLGVISGKYPGGSVVLPADFSCTQPLTNCYEPKSDYFGITSITMTIQDMQDPREIILRYGTRSGLGDADYHWISQGSREIRSYVIGEWDAADTTRLLQPEERFYRHVLEFEEGPYFVSFVYTTKGIENNEAEEQMLSIIDTFQLGSSIDEKTALTFDRWSDLGIMAPTLFQQPEDLTAEDLRELYTYYCASTHTPVYEWSEESGYWEENELYYCDNYAKAEELCAFGETYFGQGNWDADDFQQIEDPSMVLLTYESQRLEKRRPWNWLNDVFLRNSSVQGDRITLQLRYFYTRTTAMPELESLDCTVTAKWTENGPVFESCQITDTVPAAPEPAFVRTEAQLSPEILPQVDQSDDTSIIDAFYLGLGLEEQGYVVHQEGMMAFTLYTQITDAGNKEMGLPTDVFPEYELMSIGLRRADNTGKLIADYLLSCSTGKIVSLTEEENETMIRGSTDEKERLIKELFE